MAKKRRSITYKDSGVDIDANDRLVELIKPAVRSTYGPRVVDRHGGFAGLFRLDYREDLFRRNYKDPVLVSCTDSVGSKVLLAIQSGHLDTVGIGDPDEWSWDPFEGKVEDGVLFARGASDEKGSTPGMVYGLALAKELGLEFAAADLYDALAALGEIVGVVTTDDILDTIFSQFCIGK